MKMRVWVLVAVGWLGSWAGAQAPAGNADASQVRLDVLVAPEKGAPLGGLEVQDFKVMDNGEPRVITSFRAVAGGQAQVGVIVLIDAVNIPYSTVSYVRGQVLKYLRADEGRLAQPTAIAILTDKGAELQRGFTKDGNLLADGLEKKEIGLRTIGRSGGFWGAEERRQLSLKALSQLGGYAGTLPGRKVVLWISPGWPLLSGPQMELSNKQEQQTFNDIVSLSTRLRQARMTIYNLDPLGAQESPGSSQYYKAFLKGVNKPSQVQLGNLGLQVLAVQSGGLAIEGSTDVTGLLKRCVAETAGWYEIGFAMAPGDKAATYHHVEVTVDKPGAVVRTRDGYYSAP